MSNFTLYIIAKMLTATRIMMFVDSGKIGIKIEYSSLICMYFTTNN